MTNVSCAEALRATANAHFCALLQEPADEHAVDLDHGEMSSMPDLVCCANITTFATRESNDSLQHRCMRRSRSAPVNELLERDCNGCAVEDVALRQADGQGGHERQQRHAVLAGAHGVQRHQHLRRAEQPLACRARMYLFRKAYDCWSVPQSTGRVLMWMEEQHDAWKLCRQHTLYQNKKQLFVI